jgi:uncharacterized phage protein (TIGR02220 family)
MKHRLNVINIGRGINHASTVWIMFDRVPTDDELAILRERMTSLSEASKTYRTRNAQALQVLEFLNKAAGRGYRAVEANLKPIRARLAYTALADIKSVIAAQCDKWRDDPKMADYLRPETLFNSTKFESYLGALPVLQEVIEAREASDTGAMLRAAGASARSCLYQADLPDRVDSGESNA